MNNNPIEIVRGFRSLRALVIGDVMLDTYMEGTASRICSEGPVPVVRKTAEHRAPGGAANTAANLRALGAEVVLLGVVGRDIAGSLLRAALREQGVDDSWLIEDEQATTLHKLRILADGQYVVRFDEDSAQASGNVERLRRLLARLERAFARCDLVVLSDYGYGVVTEEVIERLRALRVARDCIFVADSKQLHRFPRLGATVVTPNLLEARLLVEQSMGKGSTLEGQPDIALAEVERTGRALLDLVDAEHAAITLAADGVLLVGRQGVAAHLPAHPVAQASVAGAGDSFASGLALALAAGATMAEAAQIGLDAASIAVTKRWTAVAQHQELLQRVSLHTHTDETRARIPAHEAAARQALSRLMATLAGERQAGRTVVFTNGVFDILHAGHVELLRQARALGDVLVVGVNSDNSARRLKGRNRPINSERDRLALVAALDAVDHVVLFDEEQPANLIRALRPHIHVKGGDYADEALPEAEAVREVGGQIVILPLAGSHSTSGVIERIVALAGDGALPSTTGESGVIGASA